MVLLILQWCFFHRPYLMIFSWGGIWGCFASDLPLWRLLHCCSQSFRSISGDISRYSHSGIYGCIVYSKVYAVEVLLAIFTVALSSSTASLFLCRDAQMRRADPVRASNSKTLLHRVRIAWPHISANFDFTQTALQRFACIHWVSSWSFANA